MALLSGEERDSVVAELTDPARRTGVVRGMTASQAMARCPEIVLLHPRPAAEAAARRVLLDAAFSLSPWVEETAPGICTARLAQSPCLTGRSVHSPGSQQPFSVSEVFAFLATQGLSARIGFGNTPLLARYAARMADPVLGVGDGAGFLENLPLELAGPSPEAAEVLTGWGIRTLGELTALPRQDVALRLGADGAALWDRAAGREERPLRTVSLPAEFVERLEFEHGIETLEPLLFLLRRIVDQLCVRLAGAGKAAGEVFLKLDMEDRREPYRRHFRLPEPCAEGETIFRMLHTHLEGVRTEAAIVAIALRFDPVSPAIRQRELFGSGVKNPRGFAETVAQLTAIAGSGRTGSPALENTHRPDAVYIEKLDTEPKWTVEEDPPLPATGPVLRRFRPPLPAKVECRNGRPFWFRSERISGRVSGCRGPWKESGGWWEAASRWEREEWDVELPANRGLYRLVRQPDGWVLEGMYD